MFFRASVTALIALLSFFSSPTLEAQTKLSPFSDFAKQLPESQSEIMAVHNIAGHVESVLRNKALTRVLEEGKIAEIFRSVGGQDIEMLDALNWLEDQREFFPDTVAVSLAPDAYISIVDLMQFLMRLNMAEPTLYTEDFDAKELTRLEDEIQEIVKDFKLPEMTVWIQWPKAETTEELFESFKQTVAIVGVTTQLEFTQEEGSFLLSGLVADLDEDGFVEQLLGFMGIEDDDNEISNSILDIEILLRCELSDNSMRISVGNDPLHKKFKPVVLANIKDGPSEIAYAQWNSDKLHTAAAQFGKDMERWADTDLGKLFKKGDYDDTWGSMVRFAEQAQLLSKKGQTRIWAAGNQVLGEFVSQGIPRAQSLAGQDILQFVPADIESYYVDSHQNLGELIFGWIENAEERLATESMKKNLGGELEMAELMDDYSSIYYENFGPFRNVLKDELARMDSSPMAIVMDTKGAFDSLRVEGDGFEKLFQMDSDRLLRTAAIASCKNPDRYQEKIMEAYERFVDGVLGLRDLELPTESKLFRDASLSNGVQIKVFSADWMEDSKLADVEMEGDFQMHVFTHNGHVILSSSIDFSEALFASKKRVKIPEMENQSSITSRGHIEGKTIGNIYGTLMKIIFEGIFPEDAGIAGEDFAEVFTEVGELMNHVEWTVEQDGEITETNFELDFKTK